MGLLSKQEPRDPVLAQSLKLQGGARQIAGCEGVVKDCKADLEHDSAAELGKSRVDAGGRRGHY